MNINISSLFCQKGRRRLQLHFPSLLYKMALLRMEKFSSRKLKPVEERLSKCTKRTSLKRWKQEDLWFHRCGKLGNLSQCAATQLAPTLPLLWDRSMFPGRQTRKVKPFFTIRSPSIHYQTIHPGDIWTILRSRSNSIEHQQSSLELQGFASPHLHQHQVLPDGLYFPVQKYCSTDTEARISHVLAHRTV